MNWVNDTESDMLSTVSHSRNKKELVSDLFNAFTKIDQDNCFKSKELLAFVDATNGSIFISGLDTFNEQLIDTFTVFIQVPEIWEMYLEDASTFDDIVISSIKESFMSNEFRKKKKIVIKDELGNKIKV